MAENNSNNRIDFCKLGFDISIHCQHTGGICLGFGGADASSPGDGGTALPQDDDNGIQAVRTFCSDDTGDNCGSNRTISQDFRSSGSKLSSTDENGIHKLEHPSMTFQSDDVSDFYDDDSSYGSEYTTDQEGPASPTKARQLNNHRYRPAARICRLHPPDLDDTADLGYGSTDALSRDSLKYGNNDGDKEDASSPFSRAQLGYGDTVQLVSVKGQVERTRRSTDMTRRFSRAGRWSTCSGTTRSSMSSCQRREQRVRRHSKSRSSHRERMVTRSASRRLSRKHPAQVEVLRRKSTASCGCCEGELAMKQTLQDLGCSELILDPARQRMPRRVSLEYGSCGSVFSSRKPKSVSLEFGDESSRGGHSRSRMPRKISIEYVQREQLGSKQILRRRGSLDFSVGTSTLPRRGSSGKDSVHKQQHEPRRNSLGRHTALGGELAREQAQKNAMKPRRASMGGVFLRRSSLSSSSGRWGDRNEEGHPVARQPSENSKTPPVSRRSSIAHIPRKQIGQPIGHRLSIKHVGKVEYLTRDALVGRSA